ncbi:glycosyltransferase family 4 protein, partial [bacterium]|nr:glycosyltransferase family 4 protein [bacterium]
MIAKYAPSVIYTTSAPFSSHLIGARLSRQTGLPWVADFRDPYAADSRVGPHTAFHRAVRARLEYGWVQQAKRVIATTERTTADFQSRYPAEPAERWVTITNGYDEADFAHEPPPRPERLHWLIWAA